MVRLSRYLSCVVDYALLLAVATSAIQLGCSLVDEHAFPERRPHSYAPGTAMRDTAIVRAIMLANGIPEGDFDRIVSTNEEWRISSLSLAGRGISALPGTIGELGALEKLDLRYNELTTLPDSIAVLSIFYDYETCAGPCGGPVCCSRVTLNGLRIDGNRLCQVPEGVSAWIDAQFETVGYLSTDTSQLCD